MSVALEPLAPDLWTAHVPDFRFLGLRLGTRMTVARLADGGLFVHSPIAMGPELLAALAELGPVRHVVCPNLYHHVFAGDLARAAPDAEVYAPAALAKKRPDLRIHHRLEELGEGAFGGELVPVPIEGSLLSETVFVHPKTGTVVSADLVECFQETPHWPTRLYLKAGGIYQRAGLSRLLYPVFRDKKAARRSLDRLLEHDLARITFAHGDAPLEGDVRGILEDTYRFLG